MAQNTSCIAECNTITTKNVAVTRCILCCNLYHNSCIGFGKDDDVGPWSCPNCRTIVPNVQKIAESVSLLSQGMEKLTAEMTTLRQRDEEREAHLRSVEEERDRLQEELQHAKEELHPPLPTRLQRPASPLHLPPAQAEVSHGVEAHEDESVREPLQPSAPPATPRMIGTLISDQEPQASLDHPFWENAINKAGVTYADVVNNVKQNSCDANIRWFNGADDVLSNLYDCPLYSQGHAFSGLESLFQWRKARLLRQYKAAQDILDAGNAYISMKIGVSIKPDWKWFNSMFQVMLECARIKAEQCQEFRDELLRTDSMRICENTDNPIWGGRRKHQFNGMGHILEEVRDELKASKIVPVDSRINVTSGAETPPPPNPAFSVKAPPPIVPQQYQRRHGYGSRPNLRTQQRRPPLKQSNYVRHQNVSNHPYSPYQQSNVQRSTDNSHSAYKHQRTCYQCGEAGHIARDCGHGQSIRCDNCGGYGHKYNACPSYFVYGYD